MYHQYREGYIEVICGCMFAGKTEELIRRINVLSYAKQKILVFKPKIDDRYSEIEIASHSGRKVPCYAIDDPEEILDKVTAVNFVTNSPFVRSSGITPNASPLKSLSNPATMTRTPLSARYSQTSTIFELKNCTSSIATT